MTILILVLLITFSPLLGKINGLVNYKMLNKRKVKVYVEDYARHFRRILRSATQDQVLADHYQVNYFINGLLPIFVSQVVIANPDVLNAAIKRAKLVEDEYSDEYWEDDEQKVFVTTRAKLYPSNPVSKNRRNHRSESQREEELRSPVQSEATPPFISPIEDSTPTLIEVEKQRKKRG